MSDTTGNAPFTGVVASVLPGSVVAYAGPMTPYDIPYPLGEPYEQPTTVSTGTLTFGCNHAEEFKRLEEHMVRMETLLGEIKAGMAIREAMEELLRKLGEYRGDQR